MANDYGNCIVYILSNQVCAKVEDVGVVTPPYFFPKLSVTIWLVVKSLACHASVVIAACQQF